MNCNNFSCSNAWLARFKARHNVSARVVCGEAAHGDHEGAAEWQNGPLPATLANYAMKDVLSLDESALSYRLLPNRTLAFKGENCTGGKHAKERLSVAFTVNATGTQKLPLFVIGRFAKPRCFKGAHLPSGVIYRSNTKAWMTSKLFEEYIRLLDRRFAGEKGKVLLVLNNATSPVVLDNATSPVVLDNLAQSNSSSCRQTPRRLQSPSTRASFTQLSICTERTCCAECCSQWGAARRTPSTC